MFNKLKQFKDLRDKAKTMQHTLADESITVTSSGVHLTMNGNLELTDVQIDVELLVVDKKSKLQSAIMDAHKDAMKKMQRIMAMKMKEMGGLPNIPGLS
ncbi:MAG: YbaB/EbfC family nucleoid-associated protein [Candidatus Magasanikbacteria bacterium]|nr:YbaB/EbfC family nucleoid-associated protein [Candidatus Magasanikbacteria bacterium]